MCAVELPSKKRQDFFLHILQQSSTWALSHVAYQHRTCTWKVYDDLFGLFSLFCQETAFAAASRRNPRNWFQVAKEKAPGNDSNSAMWTIRETERKGAEGTLWSSMASAWNGKNIGKTCRKPEQLGDITAQVIHWACGEALRPVADTLCGLVSFNKSASAAQQKIQDDSKWDLILWYMIYILILSNL